MGSMPIISRYRKPQVGQSPDPGAGAGQPLRIEDLGPVFALSVSIAHTVVRRNRIGVVGGGIGQSGEGSGDGRSAG
jgi:hypothetical protein